MDIEKNKVLSFLDRAEVFMERVERSLLHTIAEPNWEAASAFRYQKLANGNGVLKPILHMHTISLADLSGIDVQKERVRRNTHQFVRGFLANNVLLTGAPGTGKSSLIKALLSEYSKDGLRLIEIEKSDLVDLPEIIELIAEKKEKFIIFCDDLSFDDGDSSYKALKSVLDGSLSAPTSNLLIYATSNRRHLLPEYMADNLGFTHNEDGEVHPREAIDEKISLSDRFGLWVSFYSFAQDDYWLAVQHWLGSFGLDDATIAASRVAALQWALERSARSGRVAWQFSLDYVGRLNLMKS